METLSIRETRKYVGTWSHLDTWRDVGSFKVLNKLPVTPTDEDEEDMTEPRSIWYDIVVIPNPGITVKQAMKAIEDTWTKVGCAHEYDCCGCRSYYVRDISVISKKQWLFRFRVFSSRNF